MFSSEDSIFSLFDQDNDHRLKILDCKLYPTKTLLEEEFRTIVKHDDNQGVDPKFKIFDIDGSEITVNQLLDKYLSDPESCFTRGYPEFNDK